MAGDWIPMRHCLHENPKVLRIAEATGLDVFGVIGRLHRVWCWFDEHTADGNACALQDVTLVRITLVTQEFVALMRDVGWLENTPTGIRMVDFDAYVSKSAKQRACVRKRVKRFRNASALPQNRTEQKKISSSKEEDTHEFLTFWKVYPRKVGKQAAKRAFVAASKRADPETILAAVEAFAVSAKGRGEFCPHPTTWLNQGRWEDDPATWHENGKASGKVVVDQLLEDET